MSESPAARRKRSIPKEMPFNSWVIQKVMEREERTSSCHSEAVLRTFVFVFALPDEHESRSWFFSRWTFFNGLRPTSPSCHHRKASPYTPPDSTSRIGRYWDRRR